MATHVERRPDGRAKWTRDNPDDFIVYVRKEWDDKRLFAKSMREVWQEMVVTRFFTREEKALLLDLQPFCDFGTNRICGAMGEAIDTLGIAELVGLSDSAARKTINSLVRKNALCQVKSGYGYAYYMNPDLFYQGKKPDSTLVSLFSKHREEKLLLSDARPVWVKGEETLLVGH